MRVFFEEVIAFCCDVWADIPSWLAVRSCQVVVLSNFSGCSLPIPRSISRNGTPADTLRGAQICCDPTSCRWVDLASPGADGQSGAR